MWVVCRLNLENTNLEISGKNKCKTESRICSLTFCCPISSARGTSDVSEGCENEKRQIKTSDLRIHLFWGQWKSFLFTDPQKPCKALVTVIVLTQNSRYCGHSKGNA